MWRVGGCTTASRLAEVCAESRRLDLLRRWQHVLFHYTVLALTVWKPGAKQTAAAAMPGISKSLSFPSPSLSVSLSHTHTNTDKYMSVVVCSHSLRCSCEIHTWSTHAQQGGENTATKILSKHFLMLCKTSLQHRNDATPPPQLFKLSILWLNLPYCWFIMCNGRLKSIKSSSRKQRSLTAVLKVLWTSRCKLCIIYRTVRTWGASIIQACTWTSGVGTRQALKHSWRNCSTSQIDATLDVIKRLGWQREHALLKYRMLF